MSIVFFLVGALIVLFDQVTKHAVVTNFLPGESRTVVPRVFFLTYVQNTHGAFGFFGSHPLLLAVAALAVVLMFYYWYRQDSATLLTHVAFGLIIGGAVGNIIDRLRLHYVIDFFDLHIQGTPYYWPVFNVADSAISVGVGLLLLRILLHERRPSARATALAEPPSERSPAES
jgi:signal peptidase II